MGSLQLEDCPEGVKACGGLDASPLPSEERDETLSSLRVLPPTSTQAAIGPETVFDRRERRETPTSVVLPSSRDRDRATLTVLSGMDSGSVLALQHSETILGRSKGATVSIDEPSISRSHARIVRAEGGLHFLEDLSSKNGTFLNGTAIKRVPLKSGDRIQLGPDLLLRFALVDEREETLQRRLYESSTRDALTGLANRRSLFERLECEIARGRADDSDTGILMIDVDHFKPINDTFGHLAGDQVLRALAMASVKALRSGDLLARYGGEEFVAVICCATKGDLVALAERIRLAFGAVRLEVVGGSVAVTVSIGAALWSECASGDYLGLVGLADERMYSAKLAGRNQVCSSAGEARAGPEGAAPPDAPARTLRPPEAGPQSIRPPVPVGSAARSGIRR